MAFACLMCATLASVAQVRTVAITVDDLPYADGDLPGVSRMATGQAAVSVNERLLAAFRRHHVPVTGFVVEQGLDDTGRATGKEILKQWVKDGFDLGNHSYSHPDTNTLSVEQIEEEIVKGETTIRPLMLQASKSLTFFRFPMNHTGDTPSKHAAIAAFLTQRGYQVATCTIDNSDYLFNAAYVRMLAAHDAASAQKLRVVYLDYTSEEIDYYAGLNKQVFGYEPPQVMLLHDSRLNADVVDSLLALFAQKSYAFVSLAKAQSDPAYRTPDTFVTQGGPMWGYRWAKERTIKVDGRLEPDPPHWVLDYGKQAASSGR